MSRRLNVVVGITGGIAAYKAVGVIRLLVLAGHDVHVVATDAALRFVGRPTLEAISRNLVHSDLYEGVAQVRHVAIGQAADLIIVAPATANTIAALAAGLAGDLLGNTILASTAPLVIAPAMHSEMWQNPATVANVALLTSRGVTVVGPESGQLTGTDAGPGRMAEPEDIVAVASAVVGPKDLLGRRVVISAGGTREPLDPVRFIGNRSSGRQGIALARAAAARGAEVTVVAANLEIAVPAHLDAVYVGTALELASAMTEQAERADIIIMAAAVADYRPARVESAKIKKEQQGDTFDLQLVKNPDILRGLVRTRRPGQRIVGFAAETESDRDALLALARAKVKRKGADLLVLNRVGWSEGFATERNEIIILDGAGDIVGEAAGSKLTVADRILDLLA